MISVEEKSSMHSFDMALWEKPKHTVLLEGSLPGAERATTRLIEEFIAGKLRLVQGFRRSTKTATADTPFSESKNDEICQKLSLASQP